MEKAFMDPVHGFIVVDEPWLLACIAAPEVQRLRRIRQLGASFGTYHGAEHTRFGHALGTLHIMQAILRRLERVSGPIDEETRIVALAAALLHDVGHGPFSHALEHHLSPARGHEAWSQAILQEDTGLHRALADVDPGLPARVAQVIGQEYEPAPWVVDLVSSQLDVDRMDYLLRDALFTGTGYGRFDLDRIIHTLRIVDGRIVLMAKGLQAVEEYVLARHFMYWRVYLHKTTRGQEVLLQAAWRRAARLAAAGTVPPGLSPALAGFWEGRGNLADYLALDDHDVWGALKVWARADDNVLGDLSRRFLQRKLLKPVFGGPTTGVDEDRVQAARAVVHRRGWDPEFYCLVDRAANVPYDDYVQADPAGGRGSEPILILDVQGRLHEISSQSNLIRSLAGRRMEAVNLYVPEACRGEVQQVMG